MGERRLWDDFHVVGNPVGNHLCQDPWRLQVGNCQEGQLPSRCTDLKTQVQSDGNFKIVIDQEAYIETVADLDTSNTTL